MRASGRNRLEVRSSAVVDAAGRVLAVFDRVDPREQ